MADQNDKDNHNEVTVLTTSGSYPATGTDRVSVHQKVRQELEKAARELKITDTAGWVAEVGGRVIDPEKSYVDNNLSGKVRIDYRREHGGGGRA